MGADRQPATVRAPDEQHACYRPSGQLSEVRWMHLSVAALGAGLLGGVLTALLTVAASSSTEWFPASWVTGVLVPLGVLAWVARRLNRAGKTPTQKTPAYLPAGAMAVAFGAAALTALLESQREVDWADLDLASMVPTGTFAGVTGGTVGLVTSVLAAAISVSLLMEQRGRISLAGAHMLVAWVAGLLTFAAAGWIAFVFGQPLVVFPAVAMAVTTALRAARHSLS
ncbi:hypothetical protein LWF15_21820 [Kineosporia rhizophila]|uniref:hypothetical protein n=1 Tax=Kineosporia TaxID=49184 RepID=UPI001E5483A7|nr:MULTISPECIES: hypothetical protein [Kineosporia]MCE0538138.1 hypothetical protein [Kineosporia rhizophila]GLY14966.1 hypothetical protein Kisp01_19810 [Kineosporia sp. NBRC 101677]